MILFVFSKTALMNSFQKHNQTSPKYLCLLIEKTKEKKIRKFLQFHYVKLLKHSISLQSVVVHSVLQIEKQLG